VTALFGQLNGDGYQYLALEQDPFRHGGRWRSASARVAGRHRRTRAALSVRLHLHHRRRADDDRRRGATEPRPRPAGLGRRSGVRRRPDRGGARPPRSQPPLRRRRARAPGRRPGGRASEARS
jgi:hypothetical protein